MRIEAPLTRRGFLGLLASLAGMLVAQRLGPLEGWGRALWRESLASRLVGLFRVPASAAAVGRAYLQLAPLEADARRLLRLICSSGPAWHTANAGRLRSLIARQQAEDFQQGRVVSVQGWTLSNTEARLCALAALSQRNSLSVNKL